MQIHVRGYEANDPRVKPAAGNGIDRPAELPDEMDVLIVGTGPAASVVAAQLSRFPSINARAIERRAGRLEVGQADGIQARSVETFQAFGFANEVIDEAYRNVEMCFWKPSPQDPSKIVRVSRAPDDATGMSEFPHIYVNQSRILDYFLRDAVRAPGRIVPDYGIEFVDCKIDPDAEYAVTSRLRYTAGPQAGEERTVRSKYLLGGDGARSRARGSRASATRRRGDARLGRDGRDGQHGLPRLPGQVLGAVARSGNLLLIPREGGYLSRIYVDLGAIDAGDAGAIRATSIETMIDTVNGILSPYSTRRAGRDVVVGVRGSAPHQRRLRRRAGGPRRSDDPARLHHGRCLPHPLGEGRARDERLDPGRLQPRLEARRRARGQGTRDAALDVRRRAEGHRSEPHRLRQGVVEMMARPVDSWEDPTELEQYYVATMEFPAGFMTQYAESMITLGTEHQDLAAGFPVGKRFKSAEVIRRADNRWRHLGHFHEADGRWRVYLFADAAAPATSGTPTSDFADWWAADPASPRVRYTSIGGDDDAVFDTKVIYQQEYTEFDPIEVPHAFQPIKVPYGLRDTNQIFASGHGRDIFHERDVSRAGAIVLVRPDQYVAGVLPLTAREELTEFFARHMLEPAHRGDRPRFIRTIAEKIQL